MHASEQLYSSGERGKAFRVGLGIPWSTAEPLWGETLPVPAVASRSLAPVAPHLTQHCLPLNNAGMCPLITSPSDEGDKWLRFANPQWSRQQ